MLPKRSFPGGFLMPHNIPLPSPQDPEARELLTERLIQDCERIGLVQVPLPEDAIRMGHGFFVPALPDTDLVQLHASSFPDRELIDEEGFVFYANIHSLEKTPHFVFFRDGRVEIREHKSTYTKGICVIFPSWAEGYRRIFQTLLQTLAHFVKEMTACLMLTNKQLNAWADKD